MNILARNDLKVLWGSLEKRLFIVSKPRGFTVKDISSSPSIERFFKKSLPEIHEMNFPFSLDKEMEGFLLVTADKHLGKIYNQFLLDNILQRHFRFIIRIPKSDDFSLLSPSSSFFSKDRLQDVSPFTLTSQLISHPPLHLRTFFPNSPDSLSQIDFDVNPDVNADENKIIVNSAQSFELPPPISNDILSQYRSQIDKFKTNKNYGIASRMRFLKGQSTNLPLIKGPIASNLLAKGVGAWLVPKGVEQHHTIFPWQVPPAEVSANIRIIGSSLSHATSFGEEYTSPSSSPHPPTSFLKKLKLLSNNLPPTSLTSIPNPNDSSFSKGRSTSPVKSTGKTTVNEKEDEIFALVEVSASSSEIARALLASYGCPVVGDPWFDLVQQGHDNKNSFKSKVIVENPNKERELYKSHMNNTNSNTMFGQLSFLSVPDVISKNNPMIRVRLGLPPWWQSALRLSKVQENLMHPNGDVMDWLLDCQDFIDEEESAFTNHQNSFDDTKFKLRIENEAKERKLNSG